MGSMFEADYWRLADDAWVWIVVLGFLVAFILAFGIGANDIANSFGSSVGAKVLTLKQACLLGAIFETLGAVLIGAKVSNTIRKGIITIDSYGNGTEQELMMGNLSALSGSCIWMLVASFLGFPVSGTHSIVGATLGFSLVARGTEGVNWSQLGMIVASWFMSPLLSGIVSTCLFFVLYKKVLTQKNPLMSGLKLLPLFYGLTFAVNLFSIFYKGSELLHFNKIPLYGTFILTIVPAILGAILVRVFVVPWQRDTITKKCSTLAREKEENGLMESDTICCPESKQALLPPNNLNNNSKQQKTKLSLNDKDTNDIVLDVVSTRDDLGNSVAPLVTKGSRRASSVSTSILERKDTCGSEIIVSEEDKRMMARNKIKDSPESASLFSFLQILTAVFGSFVHGGNDVSNSIGPLVALWITAQTGETNQTAPVPVWILMFGSVGMTVGLFVMGRRVMKTMGENLTIITPSSGFSIEVGSAVTVLIASNVGIPISTTHCKVGSIVFVGWYRSRVGVDWKLFRNIVIAWFVTLPIAGGLSAAIMAILREVV